MKLPRSFLMLVVATGLATSAHAGGARIAPWDENPSYWSLDGEPVLLLGGSDDDNPFQWPEAQLVEHLDRLVAAGGNVLRNTMSDRPDKGFEVYPFLQLEDGRFDLAQWNPGYWSRLDFFLAETARRGIVVQVELWDRFDFTDVREPNWQRSPYHPANNINYTAEESGLADSYRDHPAANKQPFFFTTPAQANNAAVYRFQEAFIDRVLDHTLPHGHVLYCIDNETSGDEAWSAHWARHIRERAAREGLDVHVTEMWDEWNITSPIHHRTYDHPALYSFVDVSQNNHMKGEQHWANLQAVRALLAPSPRPINNTKIYGADTYHFGEDQDGIERFWRQVLGGGASARFHRPTGGLGLGDKAVASLRAARLVEASVPLWTVEPRNDLLAAREENEAYLAAAPGEAYVLYFPAVGEVALDLPAGSWTLQWIDIDAGAPGPASSLDGEGATTLAPPGGGNWVAVITPVPGG